MDPDTALTRIRALIAKTYTEEGMTSAESCELTDLIEALDGWLTKGGFTPAAWTAARSPLGELTAHDHLLTRAGSDLDGISLPYVIGTSLMLYPDIPIFVRLKKHEHRAVIQFGYLNACLTVYAETAQVDRLAVLFAHVRDRLT